VEGGKGVAEKLKLKYRQSDAKAPCKAGVDEFRESKPSSLEILKDIHT
jgi:hypothetical protein